jgi:uncharacterized membrane protein
VTDFARGVVTGLAAATCLLQAWLAVNLSGLRAMYADIGFGALPATTALVLSPIWCWGVVGVGLAAVVALCWCRPRGAIAYGALTVALIGALAATWYFAYAPITALAGQIQG